MALRTVLKNYQAFLEKVGFMGDVKEYAPPNPTVQTEDARGAGLDAALSVDMGMEPMEASLTFLTYDATVLRAWGKADDGREISVRGALQDMDGNTVSVKHILRGRIPALEQGAWVAGQIPDLKLTMKVHSYRCEHGGEVIHEIDIENAVRIIDGVDQLAALRDAIGAR
jgi:P2 family phage contractile tail tube protein